MIQLRFLFPVLILVTACESPSEEPKIDCNSLADKNAIAACKQQEREKLARDMTSRVRGIRR